MLDNDLNTIEFSGIATGATIRIIQEKYPKLFDKYYNEGKETYLQIRNLQNGKA